MTAVRFTGPESPWNRQSVSGSDCASTSSIGPPFDDDLGSNVTHADMLFQSGAHSIENDHVGPFVHDVVAFLVVVPFDDRHPEL